MRPSLLAHMGREGSFVGKGFAAFPLVTHSKTSCHTTRRLKKKKQCQNHQKKKGKRGKERGRRWGVETSSSLSLATVLALSVAGTQMSTLLGHTGQGDVRIAKSRDGRLAGALLPIHKSTSRRRRGGYFQAP